MEDWICGGFCQKEWDEVQNSPPNVPRWSHII